MIIKLNICLLDELDNEISKSETPVTLKADGSFDHDFKAPSSKLGFYRLKASLSDGTTIAKLGSRPAGFITSRFSLKH